jgi:hypothetical protein
VSVRRVSEENVRRESEENVRRERERESEELKHKRAHRCGSLP